MRKQAVLAVGMSVAVLGACGPSGLGSAPEDGVALTESPALRHIAQALQDGQAEKVQDLFGKNKLAFDRAPDPSALLQDFLTTNTNRQVTNGETLSVLSYNVALLSVRIAGVYKYAESPELDVRRNALPDLVLRENFDVVMLQEVWHAPDIQRFKDAGPRHGYRVFVQDHSEYSDGLIIFIKEAHLAAGEEPELEAVPYDAQDAKEFFPGPGIKRGWLRVSFTHPTLGKLHVYDTHMQAFPEAWGNRMQQARQLGLDARAHTGDGEVAIIGGDMNAGPYYRDDTWRAPGGDSVGDWWSNAISYPMLLHYAGAVDLFSMGQEAQDVHLGNSVVNDPQQSTAIPGASEGWCAATPAVVFTASDCNGLYFRQYAGTEYPARLDHLFAVDGNARVHVVGSGLMFTRPIEFVGEGTFEMSDHYGVHTSLLIAR